MDLRHTFLQHGRGLEWLTSSIILVFALVLALPGDTLGASRSFSGFVGLGLDEGALIMPLTLLAAMRMAGLWINGNWRRSPYLRRWGAIMGAGIFASLAAMFAVPVLPGEQAAITTGVGTYMVLAVFDILAAYRAAADVGIYRVSQRD